MRKTIFVLLSSFLLLAACATPQVSANTQIPPTPTAWITSTPPAPTGTPFATASPQPSGVLILERLQMIDANVGWAEGYVSSDGHITADAPYYLLRTTDGGETWQDVTPPTRFSSPSRYGESLFAIDADTAWAIPPGFPFSEDPPYILVWRTTDGGKSWKPSNPIDISDSPLRDASPRPQFVDEKHGWLTLNFEHRVNAYYLEYRTSDGGVTWEQIESCYTYDGDFKGCNVPLFTDAQTGWLNSPPDYIPNGDVDLTTVWRVQRTLDGGATWQTIDLPHARENLYCYKNFRQAGAGMVALRVTCYTSPDEESYYYLSADRGQTWQIIPLPETVPPLSEIFFLDSMTGWRLSESENGYQLERTLDGGVTWQTMAERVAGGLQFVDANHGWARIYNDSGDKLELHRTVDGGKTWQKLTPRLLPASPNEPAIARLEVGQPLVFESIQMIDNSNGWALGADGYVFRTSDGGKTWQDVTPLYGKIFVRRGFFALNTRRAWTTVSSSTVSIPMYDTIWSTSDGGQSWHEIVAMPEGQVLSPGSLQFLNENIGWFQWSKWPYPSLSGDAQELHLMKTRDNGISWEVQSIGQYRHYTASWQVTDRIGFMFLDEQNGFRTGTVEEQRLDELLSASPALLSKTNDGGTTWQPVDLPPMVLDTAEIDLNQRAYPGGIQELMQSTLSCDRGITLRAFSSDTIGLRVICRGAYREVTGTYGYVFVLSQYYLSTDAGATWNNWVSFGDDVPREDDITPVESEFFLPGGIGWRLKANQLLQTTDGGKTWTALKAVGWDQAQFNFINAQEGWAIVKSGHAISLVHTTDGGKTWEEIKPVVAP